MDEWWLTRLYQEYSFIKNRILINFIDLFKCLEFGRNIISRNLNKHWNNY